MTHPVVHFEIGGRDLDRLREFYTGLFGWRIDATDPGYRLIDDPGGGIGGAVMRTHGDMKPYVTFYVSTDDLEATLSRVTELGGNVLVKPTEIPMVGSFAMLADPEGHMIGLFAPRADAEPSPAE